MRYGDLLKRVMESRFVMLLANSKDCRIGGKCGEGEKVAEEVEISYFTVRRGKRENVKVDFDCKVISAQNIGFFDVEADVIDEESGVVVVIVTESAERNEVGEVVNATDKVIEKAVEVTVVADVNFSSFACFIRICSCNLMLLLNFSE